MAKKKRADLLLVEQGLAESQSLAASLIMAGKVFRAPPETVLTGAESASCPEAPESFFLPHLRVDKPGDQLPEDAVLLLKEPNPYVSRGAYKLLTALERFQIDVQGLVALDAGASTGGFTDCLLRRGAARVYAVDVGHNQLHERLRADPRVVSLEGVNLRTTGPELLPEPIDLLVSDVSFISLAAILPSCLQFLKPQAQIIALIKPQFELPAELVPKGVVRREEDRERAVKQVLEFAEARLGFRLVGVIPSALKGPKGNQEYLVYWKRLGATAEH